jgi:diguanylate cyclase (GGDEF)-like protein
LASALAGRSGVQAYALGAVHALRSALPALGAAVWVDGRLLSSTGFRRLPERLRQRGKSLAERAEREGGHLAGTGESPAAAIALRGLGPGAVLMARPADAQASKLLPEAAELIGAALALFRSADAAEDQARRDPLTGLPNHGAMRAFLSRRLSDSGRVGVVMIDVDHFRRFNEEHGHAAGDQALILVGSALRQSTPPGCLAARYGGEEFTLILPGRSLFETIEAAEGARRAVAGQSAAGASITASFGAAAFPDCGLDAEQLLARADQALYRAKRDGRNRVEAWRPDRRDVAEAA